MLKYIFQIKYTEAILSNRTRKLLLFEITKKTDCSFKNKVTVLFVIIFGTHDRFPRPIHSRKYASMNRRGNNKI